MMLHFIFLIVLVTCINSPAYSEEKCLKIGATAQEPYRQVALRLSKVFHEAGICHHLIIMPQKRLTSLLLDKQIDGDLVRVASYENTVGHVAFPIKPSYTEAHGLLVVKDPAFRTLDDLKEAKLGIIRGALWQKAVTKTLKNVIPVSQIQQLPRMLHFDRLDGFLVDSVGWQELSKTYPDLHSYMVIDLSAHIYLLHEHKEMGAKISQVLQSRKAERIRIK